MFLVFYSNGKYDFTNVNGDPTFYGDWYVSDNIIHLDTDQLYEYNISGNTLDLSIPDGNLQLSYTKQ